MTTIFRRLGIIALLVSLTVISTRHARSFADDVDAPHSEFHYVINRHSLDINLEVVSHTITASDTMQITLPAPRPDTISFMLNSGLEVHGVEINGLEAEPERKIVSARTELQKVTLRLPKSAEKEITVTVKYNGEIYDPVITAKELGHLRGDVTAGLICEDGVYLAASTYWYPVGSAELSHFDLNARIADPYHIVTQGELKERRTEDGLSISRWTSHVPADGLAVVGGRYVIHTRTVDGIDVSSYFFEEDDHMSDLFLDAAIDYIKLYSEILGQYPYKKFDVVENFFSTGYGMPSYTLLGNYVIKRGKGSLHPGYLDHEIVHSWFGNYVFNDTRRGNWVEALTTYCANYYYKELKLGGDEAVNHRKNASLKYSIRVKKEKDYPVRAFVTKTHPFDNEIGYTKGSMVFHQLRRHMGDDRFFKGLRLLVKDFGGRYAEWDDIETLFEDVSGMELGWLFFQWIDVEGAPELRLEDIACSPTDGGHLVKGVIAQLGNVYQLHIPVQIDFGTNVEVFAIDTNKKRKSFEFIVGELPVAITIDPEHHLFRRIAPADITPCLNALLEDDGSEKVFVYPTKGGKAEKEAYRELVDTASRRVGGRVIADNEASPQTSGRSIFLAGDARNAKGFETLFDRLPDGLELGDDFFVVDGEKYSGQEYAILVTFRNPQEESRFITTYFGLSPQSVSRARYIFFYGWDGYIVFKNGRPVKRGSFGRERSDVSHSIADSLTDSIIPASLMKHIKRLSSEDMAGRYPGTEGDTLAREYIKNVFRKYHINPCSNLENSPYEQRFDIAMPAKDIEAGHKTSAIATCNIVGILNGNDPELKDEVVVVGAHYDHLGRDADGNIFYGADDNASGVAALLEIARTMAQNRDKIRRSVVFVAFGAEEQGLQGSRHFVNNTPWHGKEVVAMVNMDSIGKGNPQKVWIVGSSIHTELGRLPGKFLKGFGLTDGGNIDKHAFVDGSDHYPFHLKGIPAIDLFSTDYHELHKITDRWELIDGDKVAAVCKLTFMTLYDLATRNKLNL